MAAARLREACGMLALDDSKLERLNTSIRGSRQQLHAQQRLAVELVRLSEHMRALSATGTLLLSRVDTGGPDSS